MATRREYLRLRAFENQLSQCISGKFPGKGARGTGVDTILIRHLKKGNSAEAALEDLEQN